MRTSRVARNYERAGGSAPQRPGCVLSMVTQARYDSRELMQRREFIGSLLSAAAAGAQTRSLPNVVLIYADDLGSGGSGVLWASDDPHSESRQDGRGGCAVHSILFGRTVVLAEQAALMTGRYPVRSGINFVLFPDSAGGLPATETTMAEILRRRGYATHITGKWHLGHLPQYLPTKHGFDSYFGIPYSNDMSTKTWPYHEIDKQMGRKLRPSQLERYRSLPGVQLFKDEQVVETEPDQTQLTSRYLASATDFIRKSSKAGKPFFLYFPHTFPHVPLFASERFRGRSKRGLYGDAVEELDWSVGEVLKTLAELKLDSNTLVLFSSDNGGAVMLGEHGGSNGALREGKATTWEGGMREPFIARWKGRIAPGQVFTDVASTLDILPTVAKLAGAPLPADTTARRHGSGSAAVGWEATA